MLEKSLLCVETALAQAEVPSLTNALKEFTTATCNCLFDMISSKYGSFVGRRLLCILSGRDVSSFPRNRKAAVESNDAKGNEPLNAKLQETDIMPRKRQIGDLATRVGDGTIQSKAHANIITVPHPELLKDIVQVVSSSEWTGPELVELVTGPFSGPFFQSLVLATVETNFCSSLIYRLLGGSAAGGSSSVTSDMLLSLMTDKGGSHMVEVALTAAPEDIFQKLCSTAFKGRITSLAQHPTANFAVQAALGSVRKPAQLKRMCEDLCPAISSLLRARRGGVVVTLLAACKRLGIKQKEVANTVWDAIATTGEDCANPVVSLLCLDTVNSDLSSKSGKRLSPIGCAALITMLQFPADAPARWSKAIARLQPEEVLTIARDPEGCHSLE